MGIYEARMIHFTAKAGKFSFGGRIRPVHQRPCGVSAKLICRGVLAEAEKPSLSIILDSLPEPELSHRTVKRKSRPAPRCNVIQ